MKITKKNGNVTVYDDDLVIRSILRANAEVPAEKIGKKRAAAIADEVFSRLTENSDVLSTADVRGCVYEVLREQELLQTAEHYMNYRK